MTTIPDREWEGLGATWREPSVTVDVGWVRAIVDRQTRWLRVVVAVETLITAAALVAAIGIGLSARTATALGWGVAAVVHTVLVAGFTVWNRSGIWRPLGASTREYLALARERCLRQQRSARFMAGLVFAEAVGFTIWAVGADAELPRGAWRFGLALVTGGALAWSFWYDRAAARRIVRLGGIERALSPAG